MSDTIWVLTEYFEDAPAETTLFNSEPAAHTALADRARDGGLPEDQFEPADSDAKIAKKMLAFWNSEMRLDPQEVTA